jgi:hypothetical protein
MQLEFEGRTSKIFRKHAEDALNFFLKKLNVNKSIIDALHITIVLEKMTDNDLGWCEPEEYNFKPRFFTITMDSRVKSLFQRISILAHEVVHLKQYAYGQLGHDEKQGDDFIWKGKLWKVDESNLDSYYDCPWEIEAYGREHGLYVRYLKFLNIEEPPKEKVDWL